VGEALPSLPWEGTEKRGIFGFAMEFQIATKFHVALLLGYSALNNLASIFLFL
jgi:hypothetical protein